MKSNSNFISLAQLLDEGLADHGVSFVEAPDIPVVKVHDVIAVDQDLYLDLVTALGQGVELNQVVAGLGADELAGRQLNSGVRVGVNVFRL